MTYVKGNYSGPNKARIEPEVGPLLAALAYTYGGDERVRNIAISLLDPFTPSAWRGPEYFRAAKRLSGEVSKRFRYVPDRGEYLLGIDDVTDPVRWVGDCDDAVLITGSLLASVGIPSDVLITGNDAFPFHAILETPAGISDPTGVYQRLRPMKVWGRYPVLSEGEF